MGWPRSGLAGPWRSIGIQSPCAPSASGRRAARQVRYGFGGEPLGLDRFGDLASLELVVVGFGEDGVQVVDDDDGGNLDGEKKDRCQNKGSADFTADFHGGEITANRGISKTGNPPPRNLTRFDFAAIEE